MGIDSELAYFQECKALAQALGRDTSAWEHGTVPPDASLVDLLAEVRELAHIVKLLPRPGRDQQRKVVIRVEAPPAAGSTHIAKLIARTMRDAGAGEVRVFNNSGEDVTHLDRVDPAPLVRTDVEVHAHHGYLDLERLVAEMDRGTISMAEYEKIIGHTASPEEQARRQRLAKRFLEMVTPKASPVPAAHCPNCIVPAVDPCPCPCHASHRHRPAGPPEATGPAPSCKEGCVKEVSPGRLVRWCRSHCTCACHVPAGRHPAGPPPWDGQGDI